MHPHTKFEISYAKHVGDMLWIRFSRTETRGLGPLYHLTAWGIQRPLSVFSNQVWNFYAIHRFTIRIELRSKSWSQNSTLQSTSPKYVYKRKSRFLPHITCIYVIYSGHIYSRTMARGKSHIHSDTIMVRNTLQPQVASTFRIWDSYLK